MLARRYRIHTKADFDVPLQRGFKVVCRDFVLYGLKQSDADNPRLGVIVSRKVGGAVVRNRVKRAVRRAFYSEVLPGLQEPLDIVAIARAQAGQAKGSLPLQASFTYCCRKLLKMAV